MRRNLKLIIGVVAAVALCACLVFTRLKPSPRRSPVARESPFLVLTQGAPVVVEINADALGHSPTDYLTITGTLCSIESDKVSFRVSTQAFWFSWNAVRSLRVKE